MGKIIEELEKDYKSRYYLYEKLCKEVTTQLNSLFEENKVILSSPIEFRIKTFQSISEKIERNKVEVSNISEINDLAGIRIIVLFKRDVELISRIISENFTVTREEDTSKRLSENQFGYGSIHFEITTKDAWLLVPTLKPLKGLSAEIQLRTASQHIWAASSHLLQYKKEKDVHATLVRAINRAAALLEVVDLEFERVLLEREDYYNNISNMDSKETINVDSLRYILDKELPLENRSDNENYSDLLDELLEFNIITSEDVEKLLNDNYEKIMGEEEKVSKKPGEKTYFLHVGLVRNALAFQFGKKYRDYQSSKQDKKSKKDNTSPGVEGSTQVEITK
ncbi:GTP pyrophosphokinase [Clostridium estertheticum]|uniref:RelA/SpoT domain-containing protein n=1 Tax=Clostridium estertheticum TaxID=238834 RepID=A0A7Y3SWA4_9CLOT|nr:hypothetical protein [Clostridium estertheticum]NNU76337.1 hypothetical protein [Clostridium estertheticum]WBL45832.1 hypothetical protein LOR37_14190 [Clostridium estertheticum]